MTATTPKPLGEVRSKSQVAELLGCQRSYVAAWVISERIPTYMTPNGNADGIDEAGVARLRRIADRARRHV